ncbi:vacuolar fusion protein MON1 homolog A [Drosophila guanche]|uniref:Vacuolar fusion protein MON1 homolog n=1 Tax=Drosophila guanche TaxID=7266 RepID=A0A3B0JZM6_DROGU|nr:vacuolar fusion protein MON1 homolog A [Drosophila guanche]SPP79139.1 blast:Vacuolar fusion protein MON1 homolog A [Drosophila guanche]
MEIQQTSPSLALSDTNSTCEYLDAEGEPDPSDIDSNFYEEADHDHDQEAEQQKHSIISELRDGLEPSSSSTSAISPEPGKSKGLAASVESLALSTSTSAKTEDSSSNSAALDDDQHDYQHDSVWRGQKKHIFILSEAGKPIFSLHGNEDKLVTLFGVIQALVSFVQLGQDAITSIHAGGIKFAFMQRSSLILVAATRTNMSVHQLHLQLGDVYNQILSILTYSHMTKIFEKRKNFDLRRLLSGSERLFFNLLANDSSSARVSNNIFTFLTNSIRVFPLSTTVRSQITSAIQSNCSKIKNLVFAVLIANNKLIALVRMKKYSIHPADLRLIFNLVECSESFKSSENWSPICLPKFDMNGYLHAHVSYLADDCQACLLLLSVDRDAFFTLAEAKAKITEKLRRSHCLEAINEELQQPFNAKLYQQVLGIPELRHFLYKPKSTAQLLCPMLRHPYKSLQELERLEAIYCGLLHRIHNSSQPLKLIYEIKEREVVLAWATGTYELYAVFEPVVDKATVIKYVDKLIKWIEKEYDVYFIRSHATF